MKKVLMIFAGVQYDVLNVFTQELANAFERMGISVDICDMRTGKRREWKQYIEQYDLIISFNGIWNRNDTRKLLRDNNIPVWSFLVDHPIWHHERLLLDHRNQIISCIDKKHVEYVKEYYGNNNEVFFVPHAGICSLKHKKWNERIYDVSFFGTYIAPEVFLEPISKFNTMMQELLIRIAERLYMDESLTLEGELKRELISFGIDISKCEFRNMMHELRFIDKYVRNIRRYDIIEKLLNSGIKVDVFGNGWETFKTEYVNNLCIHGSIGHEEAMKKMGQSKIVLNIMPMFSDGSHERIFTIMGAKSICFTDENKYLKECFEDEKEIFFYSMKELDLLPQKIKDVLEGKYEIDDILEKAFAKMSKYHTWDNRAKEILMYLEQIHIQSEAVIDIKNKTDYEFSQLFEHISKITMEKLIQKMQAKAILNLEIEEEYMENITKAFNAYGYWGTWKPEEGDFGVIEERAFELKNYMNKFVWLYKNLKDTKSKEILKNLLMNWETLDPDFLTECARKQSEKAFFDYDIIELKGDEVYVDIGRDIKESMSDFIMENFRPYRRIYAYEFNDKGIEELERIFAKEERIIIRKCEKVFSLDEEIQEKITFIKSDTGYMNQELLRGAKRHIKEEHPKLAISIWRGNKDIWRLAELIKQIDDTYYFYIRYYGGNLFPNGIILYAV